MKELHTHSEIMKEAKRIPYSANTILSVLPNIQSNLEGNPSRVIQKEVNKIANSQLNLKDVEALLQVRDTNIQQLVNVRFEEISTKVDQLTTKLDLLNGTSTEQSISPQPLNTNPQAITSPVMEPQHPKVGSSSCLHRTERTGNNLCKYIVLSTKQHAILILYFMHVTSFLLLNSMTLY